MFTGSPPELISKYKKFKFNDRYALTDLGQISWLLGIKITRNHVERIISPSQTTYIESILERFALEGAKAYAIMMPMVPGSILLRQSPLCPDRSRSNDESAVQGNYYWQPDHDVP